LFVKLRRLADQARHHFPVQMVFATGQQAGAKLGYYALIGRIRRSVH
jgi:hypothetical protein